MDFLSFSKERYSCRKLTAAPVEREKIDKVIAAAQASPTACNYQPYKIWVLQGEEAAAKFAQVTNYTFGAALFFVVGADPEAAWVRQSDNKNFADIDATIAATHMMLEIHDLGLETTWVGSFDVAEMKKLFPEMEKYELVAVFPAGYAAPEAHPAHLHTKRKPAEEIAERIQ